MSFAEIILRVGSAIGGWLIFIGHALTLAVIHQADCDPSSDQLWRGTMLFGFLSAIALIFAGRSPLWNRSLRWLGVPASLLALYAAYQIIPGIGHSTVAGESLCILARPGIEGMNGISATPVERAWPLAQLTVLTFGLIQAARLWRPEAPQES